MEPVFEERTFVPQTLEFDEYTAARFVQFKVAGWLILDQEIIYPYGYETDKKTPSGGCMLELYLPIETGRFDFEVTANSDFICAPTHSGYLTTTQAFPKYESNWPPDDWPWIPFWSYEPWEPIFTVLKITYYNVQVGENNSYLNQITCVVQGETYHIEVIVTACPIGRFGRVCMERCQCYNGASCHSFNGACKCAPGWKGRHCTIENPEVRISPSSSELTDLRYGQELQLTCTGYKFPIASITWFFEDVVSDLGRQSNVTKDWK
ncbi:uncharacterized protein LOC118414594 [Branchiostoma floridae]|uniref:Uncharacterized protein LOC118414594 n=1 Tax=Branchiostoma floridae TaxID=7739 RepID=A0A9J7MPH1_BRAFL|nr:uncharacterized protein LOC118414594 [Branchiostoma floridae]